MKRVVAILLSLMLLMSSFSTAFAAQAGETVQVTFTFTSDGAYAFDLVDLTYPEELSFVKAEPSVGFAGARGWSQAGLSPVYSATCTYTFKIAADAEDGVYPVTLTIEGAYSATYAPVAATISKEKVIVGTHVHAEEVVPGKAATCTETGLTDGIVCATCGEIILEQTEIPVQGHKVAVIPAVDATCTEPGLTAGQKCSVCGEIFSAQQVIPALGHTEVASEGKEPTCTEAGLTAGSFCSVCGIVLVAQEEIAPVDHTVEVLPEVAPTCTETGLTVGAVCSVCGEILIPQEVVEALGHTEEIVAGKEATCAEPGLTEGKICSVCGIVLVEQEEIAVLAHTEEIVAGKEATCTDAGLTDGKICIVCGEILAEQVEIPALGHTEEIVAGKEATCTETGLTDGKICSVCGEILAEQEEIAVLEHTAGKTAIENVVAATCTTTGSYEEVVYCDVCTAEISRTTVEVPTLEHTWEEIAAKEPTYTEEGNTAGKKCTVCGLIEGAETIPVKTPDQDPVYTIEKVSETRGKITMVENEAAKPLDEALVKITWRYTLSNGDTISVTLVRDVKEDGTFKLSGVTVPSDSVLNYIYVEVTDNEDADELGRGEYKTFGVAAL